MNLENIFRLDATLRAFDIPTAVAVLRQASRDLMEAYISAEANDHDPITSAADILTFNTLIDALIQDLDP